MCPPEPDPPPRLLPSPEQLRGLAHPLRLRALDVLRIEGPTTATALARRLGVNSGATSYHLRQLAAYGYIEEATELGTRRDRYWRARDPNTTPRTHDAAAVHGYVVACTHLLQDSLAQRSSLPEEWAGACCSRQEILHCTPAQAQALLDRIAAVVEDARAAADAGAEVEGGARMPYVVQLHTFPRPETAAPDSPGPQDPR